MAAVPWNQVVKTAGETLDCTFSIVVCQICFAFTNVGTSSDKWVYRLASLCVFTCKGGYNTLHQDLYGEIFFPFQLVFFLNEPDDDYTGEEFVLTQQIPRAQSKAIVLKPHKGDMLIITTNFRPIKGSKGYYRAQMRHGISEVHDGERHVLGIIFHDALT